RKRCRNVFLAERSFISGLPIATPMGNHPEHEITRQEFKGLRVASRALNSLPPPLIPINANVMRLPPDGDDVDAAVAVEVAGGDVFHGDAAIVENVPGPVSALVV